MTRVCGLDVAVWHSETGYVKIIEQIKYIEDNESLVSQCHTQKLQIGKERKLE